MSRLTIKDDDEVFVGLSPDISILEALQKLKKLEDIADLCEKITKLPIYKKHSKIIYEADYTGLNTAYNFLTNHIEVYDGYGPEDSLPVDKYKIDWAFTEKELE